MKAKAVVVARNGGPHPYGLRMIEGEHAGRVWVLDGRAPLGRHVVAEFEPDDQFAKIVEPESGPVTLSAHAADQIEAALREGFENCGEDPECVWAEPLLLLLAARKAQGAK